MRSMLGERGSDKGAGTDQRAVRDAEQVCMAVQVVLQTGEPSLETLLTLHGFFQLVLCLLQAVGDFDALILPHLHLLLLLGKLLSPVLLQLGHDFS